MNQPTNLDFEVIDSNAVLNASDESDETSQVCLCPFHGKRTCFDTSCINVAMMIECTECHSSCCNMNFSKRKYVNLYTSVTTGKGMGLFTHETISAGKFIIEFFGEIINDQELIRRRQSSSDSHHLYPLQLKRNSYLDATRKGGIGRFINHSCEPNCRLEVWTVEDKFRVGIFSIKSIAVDEELSIDYEWEPMADRKPTVCLCKTPSCRGYIEKFSSGYVIDDKYVIKQGVWLPSTQVPDEALLLTAGSDMTHDTSSQKRELNPVWLVGKRVKVWYEGNLAYFIADVESYDDKKGKYSVRYLADLVVTEEVFVLDWNCDKAISSSSSSSNGTAVKVEGSTSSPRTPVNTPIATATITSNNNHTRLSTDVITKWLWLDESKEEITIKKKMRAPIIEEAMQSMDDMNASSMESSTIPSTPIQSIQNSATKLKPIVTTSATPKKVTIHVSVSREVAVYILNNKSLPLELSHMEYWNQLSLQEVTTKFHEYLAYQYYVKAFPSTSKSTSLSYSSTLSSSSTPIPAPADIIHVDVIGDSAPVKRITGFIDAMESQYKLEYEKRCDNVLKDIRRNQSSLLAYNWTIPIPAIVHLITDIYSCRKSSPALEDLVQHLRRHRVYSNMIQTYLNDCIPISAFSNIQSLESSSQYTKLFDHLISICNDLKFTQSQIYHVIVLYMRIFYHTTCLESADINDIMYNISAIIILALKSRGEYRSKSRRMVVLKTYCQIYNRQESYSQDVITTAILQRAVDNELVIWTAMYADLFVSDCFHQIRQLYPQDTQMDSNILTLSENLSLKLLGLQPLLCMVITSDIIYSSIVIVLTTFMAIIEDSSLLQVTAMGVRNTNVKLHSVCSRIISIKDYMMGHMNVTEDRLLWHLEYVILVLVSDSTVLEACRSLCHENEVIQAIIVDELSKYGYIDVAILRGMFEQVMDVYQGLCKMYDMTSCENNHDVVTTVSSISTMTSNKGIESDLHVLGDHMSILTNKSTHSVSAKERMPQPSTPIDLGEVSTTLRYPWLRFTEATADSSSLKTMVKSDLSHLYAINQDWLTASILETYFEQSNAPYLHSTLQEKSDNTANENRSVRLSMYKLASKRAPSSKDDGECRNNNYDKLILQELSMLQHLHLSWNCTTSLIDKSNRKGDIDIMTDYCPYVVLPVGVLTVSPSTLKAFNLLDMANETGRHRTEELSSLHEITSTHTFQSIQTLNTLSNGRSDIHEDHMYFLLTTPVYLSMEEFLVIIHGVNESTKSAVSKSSILNKGKWTKPIPVSTTFLIAICHDVYRAIDHCTKSGIVFKWIALDQVFISLEGRFLLGGLEGAVYEHSTANMTVQDDYVYKRTKQRSKSAETSSKHTCKSIVPTSQLSNSAPEIVLGGKASCTSNIFIAGVLSTYVMTGTTIFKSGNADEKYINYAIKILGSPESNGYLDMYQLPLASLLVKKDESVTKISRINKVFLSALPQCIREDKELNIDDLVTLICSTLHLNPVQRRNFDEILKSKVFHIQDEEAVLKIRYENIRRIIQEVLNEDRFYFCRSKATCTSTTALLSSDPHDFIDQSMYTPLIHRTAWKQAVIRSSGVISIKTATSSSLSKSHPTNESKKLTSSHDTSKPPPPLSHTNDSFLSRNRSHHTYMSHLSSSQSSYDHTSHMSIPYPPPPAPHHPMNDYYHSSYYSHGYDYTTQPRSHSYAYYHPIASESIAIVSPERYERVHTSSSDMSIDSEDVQPTCISSTEDRVEDKAKDVVIPTSANNTVQIPEECLISKSKPTAPFIISTITKTQGDTKSEDVEKSYNSTSQMTTVQLDDTTLSNEKLNTAENTVIKSASKEEVPNAVKGYESTMSDKCFTLSAKSESKNALKVSKTLHTSGNHISHFERGHTDRSHSADSRKRRRSNGRHDTHSSGYSSYYDDTQYTREVYDLNVSRSGGSSYEYTEDPMTHYTDRSEWKYEEDTRKSYQRYTNYEKQKDRIQDSDVNAYKDRQTIHDQSKSNEKDKRNGIQHEPIGNKSSSKSHDYIKLGDDHTIGHSDHRRDSRDRIRSYRHSYPESDKANGHDSKGKYHHQDNEGKRSRHHDDDSGDSHKHLKDDKSGILIDSITKSVDNAHTRPVTKDSTSSFSSSKSDKGIHTSISSSSPRGQRKDNSSSYTRQVVKAYETEEGKKVIGLAVLGSGNMKPRIKSQAVAVTVTSSPIKKKLSSVIYTAHLSTTTTLVERKKFT